MLVDLEKHSSDLWARSMRPPAAPAGGGQSPLQIALVAPPYFQVPPGAYGGVEAVVADLADALVSQGHHVTLLGAGQSTTKADFVPLWPEPVPQRLGEPAPEVVHAAAVRRALLDLAEAEGLDIVHDHTLAGPLNAAVLRHRGIPTVLTVHGPVDTDMQRYYRDLGSEVRLIGISHRQRELAPNLHWLGVVHNALRPELGNEAYSARFLMRRPPVAGRTDSTLLLVRERLVADGLREVVTVENLGTEATTASLALWVAADFADLFAVKEGRPGPGEGSVQVDADALLLTATDGERGLRLTATGDAIVTPGGFTWRVVVPPRSAWSAEVTAQPILDGRPLPPRVDRGQGVETSRPARQLRRWRQASTKITADRPVLAETLRRTEDDLGVLQIHDLPGDQPVVAAGAPWFMTLFGRDSLLCSYMALPLETSLALGTLQTLGRLQGTRVDPHTEEEPGRILHELRLGPDRNTALGGSHYYGTIDATPLFVLLLAEAWRWGAPEPAIRDLLPAADSALDWMNHYGDRDGDGFLEYRRATDRGLVNQGWKDSFDGINDAAGRIGEAPIALCEAQGYAYAARLARADLAEAFGDPDTAQRLRDQAAELRTAFAEKFWLPDRGWFAIALDRDKRPLDALTSNVGHCLWSGIVRDEHAAQLIERLAEPRMNSGYGLRTLAEDMGAYNPMSYHNGSVWPHDTALTVAGLVRYAHVPGAIELAHGLAGGLLDAAAAFGGRLPELFCGFARQKFGQPVPYPTSCSPQAWASAAPLLLVRALLGLDLDVPSRTLRLQPRLPATWGRVVLDGLDVGHGQIRIEANQESAIVSGLSADWVLKGTATTTEH